MKIKLKNVIKNHLPLIFFLFFYVFVTVIKLISHPTPFYDWDEAINVQVAKETIENKSLVPLWQGKIWLDKPPLPFLFFGIIMNLTPFIRPEISLRLASLFLSLIVLVFVYFTFLKASNRFVATLTVIITSFTPIFLQRSQIVNLDVFLLIGWLGYLLFVHNFWKSLFFLSVSVLSKSLIGFYPIIVLFIYNFFLFLTKKITKSKLKKIFIRLFNHMAISAIWYVLMLFFFGKDFWQQHIIETHFRRITASIESHFGQRTYYLDLMFEQLKPLMWFSLVGLILTIINSVKHLTKHGDRRIWLNTFYLMPWFIFLNLTKTKIFWYLYSAIPQFAFLAAFPLTILKNKKTISYLLSFILILFVFYQSFVKTNFFTTFYSQPEDHYRLALFAKNQCDSLFVLVGKDTREATSTLEKMGLTIASTKQWGDHPSIVYYFGKKVEFYYDKNLLTRKLPLIAKNNCLAIQTNDLDLNPEIEQFRRVKNFDSIYLFKR